MNAGFHLGNPGKILECAHLPHTVALPAEFLLQQVKKSVKRWGRDWRCSLLGRGLDQHS